MDFKAAFSGAMLVPVDMGVEPGWRTASPNSSSWKQYVRRAWAISGAPRLLIAALAGSLGLQILGLAAPLLTKVIVDSSSSGSLAQTLTLFAWLTAAFLLSRTALAYARSMAMAKLQISVDRTLTPAFLEHMLDLPYSFFQGRSTGDLLQRVGSNATIREMLTGQLLGILLDFPFAAIYLALCFVASARFAAVVAVIALVQAVALRLSLHRNRELIQESLAIRATEQGAAVEIIRGIATIKASNAIQPALSYWSSRFVESLDVAFRRTVFGARVDLVVGMIRFGAPLILLLYGATLVRDGQMSLGTMLAAQSIAIALLGPVASVIQTMQQLQMIHAITDRVEEVMEEPREGAGSAAHTALQFQSLTTRNLQFRYQRESRNILGGIDVTVHRGQKLAIVGATGSGKSTLMHLLVGLLEPTGGTVWVNGMALRDVTYPAWRGRCGVVLQEQWLFDGTIQENVALTRLVATPDEIERVCRLAEIHDEITKWPLGYATRLGEGGRNVSGGQRQRIAIARALVGEPDVLFFDEATSHLDSATEDRVEANIRACGCTIVTAAHRVSSISNADWIIVLEGGDIVEQGQHNVLLAKCGKYSRLLGMEGVCGSPSEGTDHLRVMA
jgi:ABC-type bacteriocin/lantibiotic exporter with double-glycine peptidase domain